jgi:hypothetical protein
VPPVRAFIAELEEAEERVRRGEPGHLADLIVRLMRVSISRNTSVEERWADERDASVHELSRLRREPGSRFRTQRAWSGESKRRLVERGYRLTDEALRRAAFDAPIRS